METRTLGRCSGCRYSAVNHQSEKRLAFPTGCWGRGRPTGGRSKEDLSIHQLLQQTQGKACVGEINMLCARCPQNISEHEVMCVTMRIHQSEHGAPWLVSMRVHPTFYVSGHRSSDPSQVLKLGKCKLRRTTTQHITLCNYSFNKNETKLQKQREIIQYTLTASIGIKRVRSSQVLINALD